MNRGLPRAQSMGFSMVEIIITIALLALLVALGLFMSMEAYRGAIRRSERDTVVSLLEKARSRAMANIDESAWTVCYDAGYYIITKHPTICNDETAYDRIEANASVVANSDFSGFPIQFDQLTGNVAAALTEERTVTLVQDGRVEVIHVNHEGRINW